MVNPSVLLMNWLEEEREKHDNLVVTQQAFGESGRKQEDFLFMEALSLPIEIHKQRCDILEGLLSKELEK
jgi:hypothetical protein